jgi:hypothetical protein
MMPRLAIAVAKSAVVAVAGLGALMAALLAGMWIVMLGGPRIDGAPAALLFGGVALAALFVLALALKRLRWTWRAVAGTLLVAGSLLALPRASCAMEPAAQVGC